MASRHRQKTVFLVIYRFLYSIILKNIGKKLNSRKQAGCTAVSAVIAPYLLSLLSSFSDSLLPRATPAAVLRMSPKMLGLPLSNLDS